MTRRVCKPSDIKVQVAIVGGGLCGLALARTLSRAGQTVCVFEARERLGGRIDADAGQVAGQRQRQARVDLGPSWYWPESQPLMTQLVRELGLHDFAQLDGPEVRVMSRPNAPAQLVKLGPVHSRARRLHGGMHSLVDALITELPAEQVRLEHVLTTVHRRGQHCDLDFLVRGELVTVRARRVVLALPPRLVAERIQFEPALDGSLRNVLQATPTWMATQARVALGFEQAEWRSAGSHGNGFVLHEQAVLKEVFDACEEPAALSALGAFIALSPGARRELGTSLHAAVGDQVTQLFELKQPVTRQAYRDWAHEAYTCSRLDLDEHSLQPVRPAHGAPELRKPRWERRLFFGGSETAEVECGYMEGALHAAQRIARDILRLESQRESKATARGRIRSLAKVLPASAHHHDHLTPFHGWLQSQRQPVLLDYTQRVITLPSHTPRQTQHALLASLQRLFQAALEQLQRGLEAVHSRRDAALAPRVHEAMRELVGTLVRDALSVNRNAAELQALSAAERRPSRAYAQAIVADVYAAYRRFVRDVTRLFSPFTPASLASPALHLAPEPRTESPGRALAVRARP